MQNQKSTTKIKNQPQAPQNQPHPHTNTPTETERMNQRMWRIGMLGLECLDRRAWIRVPGLACLDQSSDGIDWRRAWIEFSKRSLEIERSFREE